MKSVLAVLVTAASVLASPAYASYLESCQFTATVKDVVSVPTLNETVRQRTSIATLSIETAINQGSHNPTACDTQIGTEQQIIVKAEDNLAVGETLKIDYFYANSRGPVGVVSSERWTIVAE